MTYIAVMGMGPLVLIYSVPHAATSAGKLVRKTAVLCCSAKYGEGGLLCSVTDQPDQGVRHLVRYWRHRSQTATTIYSRLALTSAALGCVMAVQCAALGKHAQPARSIDTRSQRPPLVL